MSLYLAHHGIFGQKWGVRRYQNPDGSLTEAGKRRYGTMDPDKLQKQLHKDIKKARSKRSGWSNQWGWHNTIGENSKKALDDFQNAKDNFYNSKEHKDAVKKMNKLDDAWLNDKIDIYEWKKQYDKNRKNYYDPRLDADYEISPEGGRKYVKEFIEGYGSDINIGFLKDLGYSDDAAKYINKKLLNAKIKTIWQ